MRLLKDEKVETVTWHFFQSDISGKLGPTRYCLQQLEAIAATHGKSFSIVVHLAP